MAAARKPTFVLFRRSYVLRRKFKRAVEHALNLKVLRVLPLGTNVHADIEQCFPGYRLRNVLDVGANIGQTAAQFSFWHPDIAIYCVEPVRENFEELTNNTSGMRNVECLRMGLAEAPGSAQMVLSGRSSTYRVKGDEPLGDEPTETVTIDTVDRLCTRLGIESISYMKIDTEGHDLKVLKGANELMAAARIDFIEVEAGMNPDNSLHVPFEVLKAHAESRGYLLFGIYEQRHDWPSGRPILRRSNAVFVTRQLALAYRAPARQ